MGGTNLMKMNLMIAPGIRKERVESYLANRKGNHMIF